MIYEVLWNFPTLATFYKLPMHLAFVIDHAVIRFATTGQGHVERVAPYYRLRAGFHDALLTAGAGLLRAIQKDMAPCYGDK